MEMSTEIKKLALEQMISKGEVNQLLYKYIKDNEHSEKIFRDHTLLFTHPNKFNDPFDCWANLEEPDFNGLYDLIENSNEDEFFKKACRGCQCLNKVDRFSLIFHCIFINLLFHL